MFIFHTIKAAWDWYMEGDNALLLIAFYLPFIIAPCGAVIALFIYSIVQQF